MPLLCGSLRYLGDVPNTATLKNVKQSNNAMPEHIYTSDLAKVNKILSLGKKGDPS